jgi:hypothetical protein
MSGETFVRARGLRLWVAGTLLIGVLTVQAEPDSSLESQVKAAFLYNFAKFVTWPTNTFANAASPFVIGVLAEKPMAQTVEKTVAGKFVGNRIIDVRQITDAAHLEPCQILFIAQSKMPLFPHGLSPLGNSNVLLVGESPGFLAAGGAISFTNDEGQMRFEVSTTSAAHAGLKISSKLLRLATNIVPSRPEPKK